MSTTIENIILGELPIALDANVFRNTGFFNYIRELQEKGYFSMDLRLPTIVSAEVGYFYRSKGIIWEVFLAELEKYHISCLTGDTIRIPLLIENAYANRGELPFQDHFRDFMIGIQCLEIKAHLITYNVKRFSWLDKRIVHTPEEFAEMLQKFNWKMESKKNRRN